MRDDSRERVEYLGCEMHLGCEKRYVWKYASFEMYLHEYRRRRKRSRTLLPFTLPRRGCWDYHPVACTHCLVIGFVRKLFKFDQRMPLTRRVYMCVCVQFLMQRGGVERALGCFVAFVRSKFFLGILLIFVLSPCARGKWSRWIFGERIFPWQGKWKCRPNNRIFPLPLPLHSARNEHAFYFPFERCLSNNKRLWIDAQGGGEAWMDNAARVSGPDVSPCQR